MTNRVVNIGNGAYGQVWYNANEGVAKKITAIKKDGLTNLVACLRELEVLKLKNDYIVKFVDMKYRYNSIEIHMEKMDYDLMKLIRSQMIDAKDIISISTDVVKGLHFLHSNHFAHRDIKPSNILIHKTGCGFKAKLCDFGLARRFCKEMVRGTDYMVTRWYRAPEVIEQTKPYKYSIDMWAFGCIIYEMVTRRAMFPIKQASDLEEAYTRRDEKIARIEDTVLNQLVNKLIMWDPKDRWDAGKCIYFLTTEPAKEHTIEYFSGKNIFSKQMKKWFTSLLAKFPDHKRAIMHGLMLFQGTKMMERDFRYAIIISHLLLETATVDNDLIEHLKDDKLNARKIARWIHAYYKQNPDFPSFMSPYEDHKSSKKVIESVFNKRKISDV